MPIHQPPRRPAPPSAHRTAPAVTGSRRAGRTWHLSLLCLTALLLPAPAGAATGSAHGSAATLPGGANDRPYSEVHLLRRTVSSTPGGGDGIRQVVDSWRGRNDLDGSGLLSQISPAAAPAVFPPGALQMWSDTVTVPKDPAGIRRFLTGDGSTASDAADVTILARIADLSSVYCPTPEQRAAMAGLINDRIGPPVTPRGPIDVYAVTANGTRWTLTVNHDTSALLDVETVDVSADGTTQVQHTDYLSCRHTHAPLAAADRSAA